MIAKKDSSKIMFLLIFVMVQINVKAQSLTNSPRKQNIEFYNLRGTNAVDFGVGTAVINGDLIDPKFDLYFHVGYKRYIFPHLNINIGYNKFNLAYTNGYNQGFMSFDLNLESTLLPNSKFSPFIFVGGGYNASNYFESTATKFQGGGGIEYIVIDGLGIKLYTDYNYVMSDELDGLVSGASDDTYFRIGFGMNFYFGGHQKKTKIDKNQSTIINSNQIIFLN